MASTLNALSYDPPGGQADWLLVALHGWGANAADLFGLAGYLNLPGFKMRFPDAPFPHPQVPGGRMWYGFPYTYDFRSPPNFQDQEDLQESRRLLQTWMESLAASTGIPLDRTVMAGFSQGGAMTLDVGTHLPLAGQIILSGYLHGDLPPSPTPRPVLVVHGRHDSVVPIALAHQTQARLRKVGLPPKYLEISMGHEILPEVIQQIVGFCEDLG